MLTNSSSKETIATHVVTNSVPSAFQFDWSSHFKEEYDLVEKLNSPQYTNLTSISPSSSTDSNNLILRQIQIPKIEPALLNQCCLCTFAIVDKEISVVDGKYYHNNCLRCQMCDIPFEYSDKCYVRDGVFLCRADHAKRYQKCCRKCEIPLNREDMVMKAKEMIFHHACFVCFICGIKLNPGDYYTMSPQGHLYCHAHYNAVRSTVLCEEAAVATVPAVVAPPPPPPTTTTAPPPAAPEQPPREASTEAEASTDEDGNGSGSQRSKRMRTSFKHHQLRAMKTYFALNHNPDAKDLKQLAAKTNLTKRVLQVWFQNARAKYRRELHDGGRSSSPLCVSAPLASMDMNPPLSSSSSGHSTDGYQLNTPPLSSEIYSPNSNYTHL
ncbi:LIM/homeobox protein ttx-3 [Caenorhabditis elegans]|nr:LIM/homeobox protein ttx-3 [Caenorhabditis elegans]CAR97817.1 LIM/homeobox protein ttx-3 [Caenorhabditis elegans]|eukprot:NP_001257169.1 LIM/homeobox protein ttx-3 [Caenorhabditis elegans]